MTLDTERLKKLREGRGWSQEQLAEAAGISVRTVQRAERDGAASRETKICLAAALDVPHGDLEAPVADSPVDPRAAPMPSIFERIPPLYQHPAAYALGIAIGTFLYFAATRGVGGDTWLRSVFVGGFVFVVFRILVKQVAKFGPSSRRMVK